MGAVLSVCIAIGIVWFAQDSSHSISVFAADIAIKHSCLCQGTVLLLDVIQLSKAVCGGKNC